MDFSFSIMANFIGQDKACAHHFHEKIKNDHKSEKEWINYEITLNIDSNCILYREDDTFPPQEERKKTKSNLIQIVHSSFLPPSFSFCDACYIVYNCIDYLKDWTFIQQLQSVSIFTSSNIY